MSPAEVAEVACRRCGQLRPQNAFCICVPQHEIDDWYALLRGEAVTAQSDTCPAVDTDPAGSACRPAMPYAEPKEQKLCPPGVDRS